MGWNFLFSVHRGQSFNHHLKAYFEGKHDSMLMTFPRHVNRFHSKMKVKTTLSLDIHVC